MPTQKTIKLILTTGLAAALVSASGPAYAVVRPASGSASQAHGTAPWSQFGFNAADSSDNTNATAITTSNAASLTQAWQFKTPAPTKSGQPKAGFDGSPVVADGKVFIGSLDGVFYALSEDTGHVVWSLNAGYQHAYTCPAEGIADTATVAADPATGNPAVYFADGDGTLWAVDAATGTVIWKKDVFPATASSAKFIWGSPLVYNGRVYIGIASECDNPLSRDGLFSFSQATGAHEATFWAVKSGVTGGSIWSSPAASATGIFVTTGNGNESAPATQGYSNSVILLNPVTLKVTSHWTVPNIAAVDDDFGASPTLFSATIDGVATPMVGACNKDGYFYALAQNDLAAGPVWSDRLGNPPAAPNSKCMATASWNGTDLFITANASTVGGVSYPAVSRELDPATGTEVWQTGLADGPVLGNSVLDGAGVLAAVSYSQKSPATTNQLVLLNDSTGAVLASYPLTAITGGGPVFADGYLIFGGGNGVLHAYAS
jgi:outer membrane protein assembly factor BamB